MKKFLAIATVLFFMVQARAQENNLTIQGGYVFASFEETDVDAQGWRINGLYEFNPTEGMLCHGLALGYVGTRAEALVNSETTEYTLNTYPIYYAPKLMFGSQRFKVFLKGALGGQVTNYNRTGNRNEVSDTDLGFYGGAGAGLMALLSKKIFISAEYEWAYLSNSTYRNGMISSVMGGIGYKF